MSAEVTDDALIIGIDPGTVMMGVAQLYFNPQTFEPTRIVAQSFNGAKFRINEWTASIHGERYARIQAHRHNLWMMFNKTHPLFIACESPFYSQRQPSAFGALTEVVCAIRDAVHSYNLWRPLNLVDPPNVKRAVGASGNADKEGVKKALLARTDIAAVCEPSIEQLDEHAIDSIAVAAFILQHLQKGTLSELTN